MVKSLEEKREQAKLRKQRQRDKERDIGERDINSVTWENIPLNDIKELLPEDIVEDIIAISEYDRIRKRPITLEDRLRLAYKYHLWHEANFIDGIHKNSKYRGFINATK